ncbi:unnamed protein product [Heligmosomoides polygyrus]|uniref:Apple domain-containing protein n=1 Tax=Heligmosomoides polygyrus TaxID=6339 RepID=A0A183GUN3_HELPZ|nr:unnamed protein product [Heligmosomoides polygyrus]
MEALFVAGAFAGLVTVGDGTGGASGSPSSSFENKVYLNHQTNKWIHSSCYARESPRNSWFKGKQSPAALTLETSGARTAGMERTRRSVEVLGVAWPLFGSVETAKHRNKGRVPDEKQYGDTAGCCRLCQPHTGSECRKSVMGAHVGFILRECCDNEDNLAGQKGNFTAPFIAISDRTECTGKFIHRLKCNGNDGKATLPQASF